MTSVNQVSTLGTNLKLSNSKKKVSLNLILLNHHIVFTKKESGNPWLGSLYWGCLELNPSNKRPKNSKNTDPIL